MTSTVFSTTVPLTPKQAAVYRCIVDTLLATQHWPTVRELGRAISAHGQGGNPNNVTCYMKILERKGWLVKVRGGYALVGVTLEATRTDWREWPDGYGDGIPR